MAGATAWYFPTALARSWRSSANRTARSSSTRMGSTLCSPIREASACSLTYSVGLRRICPRHDREWERRVARQATSCVTGPGGEHSHCPFWTSNRVYLGGMTTPLADRRRRFRELHQSGCFVIPNPWDVGSARLLEQFGFQALATTSSGFAWSLGRQDNAVSVGEALAHIRAIADSVTVPVNADFEGGFAV